MVDALPEEACRWISGYDRAAGFAFRKGALFGVQAEPGHAAPLVETVALEARVRENGADFLLEVNRRGGGEDGRVGRGQNQDTGRPHS